MLQWIFCTLVLLAEMAVCSLVILPFPVRWRKIFLQKISGMQYLPPSTQTFQLLTFNCRFLESLPPFENCYKDLPGSRRSFLCGLHPLNLLDHQHCWSYPPRKTWWTQFAHICCPKECLLDWIHSVHLLLTIAVWDYVGWCHCSRKACRTSKRQIWVSYHCPHSHHPHLPHHVQVQSMTHYLANKRRILIQCLRKESYTTESTLTPYLWTQLWTH